MAGVKVKPIEVDLKGPLDSVTVVALARDHGCSHTFGDATATLTPTSKVTRNKIIKALQTLNIHVSL